MRRVFLDTSYAVALSVASDQHHSRAMEIRDSLNMGNAQIITTQAIAIEIGNFMAKAHYRSAAVALLDALEHDPDVEVISISESLYERAFKLYRERPDKEWSLTDCISFVVMRDQNLTDALTSDDDFQQAGFRALLKEV
jgi:uncharacterized protein